jgi:hypothetical protein
MVLIALFLACAGVQRSPETPTGIPIHVGFAVEAPAEAEDARPGVERSMRSAGIRITSVHPAPRSATTGQRTEWLLERTQGDLGVLIETNARKRANLGGRFQWDVSATVVVVADHSPALTQSTAMRITLPHAHQGAAEAVAAASPRIGQQASEMVRQVQGTQP